MIIKPGHTLTIHDLHGHTDYTVRAVRHYPIDFVELEPLTGGSIYTAPMSVIERATTGPVVR